VSGEEIPNAQIIGSIIAAISAIGVSIVSVYFNNKTKNKLTVLQNEWDKEKIKFQPTSLISF